jgi:parvulin-like peptidyl-prolyl isomerase
MELLGVVGVAFCIVSCAHSPAVKPAAPDLLSEPAEVQDVSAGQQEADTSTVLAKGDGVVVTEKLLQEKIRTLGPAKSRRFQSKDMQKKLLDNIVDVELLYNEAKTRGLDKNEEVLLQVEDFRKRQSVFQLRNELMSSITVDDAELKAEYEKNVDQYTKPKKVRVSQIVFYFDKDEAPGKVAALERDAEDLLKRAQAGEDFSNLARNYSLDKVSAQKDGDIGFASRRNLPPPAYAAAMKMQQQGELSGILKGEGEIRILKATEIVPEERKPFEEVRPWLERTVMRNKQQKVWEDYLAGLRKKAHVELFEDRIGGNGSGQQ